MLNELKNPKQSFYWSKCWLLSVWASFCKSRWSFRLIKNKSEDFRVSGELSVFQQINLIDVQRNSLHVYLKDIKLLFNPFMVIYYFSFANLNRKISRCAKWLNKVWFNSSNFQFQAITKNFFLIVLIWSYFHFKCTLFHRKSYLQYNYSNGDFAKKKKLFHIFSRLNIFI